MTDWAKVDGLNDEDIAQAVASDPDAAPILDEEWFRTATIVYPERKVPVSIRIDKEVLDWFRSQGRGYQSRINAVLKTYFRAQSRKAEASSARNPRVAVKKSKRRA